MFGFRKKSTHKKREPLSAFAAQFFAYNREIVAGPPPLDDRTSGSYALSFKPLHEGGSGRPVSVRRPLLPADEKRHSSMESGPSADS